MKEKKTESFYDRPVAEPIPGKAQMNGYNNRKDFRDSKYRLKRRPKDTRFYDVKSYLGSFSTQIPIPAEARKHKKLKGWQKRNRLFSKHK